MFLKPLLFDKDKTGLRWVLVLAGIFFSLTLIVSLHRYYSFYSTYDQGIFNQVFWNNLHGRFFQSSLSSAVSSAVQQDSQVPSVFYHRLGQHFTPALLVWLPFYALFPSPVTLIFLQVTLVAAGGLVLYALARHYLDTPLAIAIAASFYGANAVIGPTLSNFHDLCQVPLFIFSLLLALEKRRWWLFWLMAALTLAIREDAGVMLFGIGVYLVASRHYPRLGLALCTVSFGYILLATNAIMPLFSPDVSKRFMIERFGQYAQEDEATSLQILWEIVRDPRRLVWELINPVDKTVKYLLGHWLPLAFVPAVSGASWAIAGFPLMQLFLQKGSYSLSINIRYAMAVVPGIFYGAILWWSTRAELFKRVWVRRFWVGCITLSVLFSFTSNPHQVFYFLIPHSIDPWVYISLPHQWNHVSHIRALMSQIPPDASVSATTNLIPHLSSRREIVRLPVFQVQNDQKQVKEVEYAIADIWQLQQFQAIYKNDRLRLQALVPAIDEVVTAQKYGVRGVQDGIVLLQKSTDSEPSAIAAWLSLRDSLRPIWQNR
ncbi:DUF2079 domain-containing protein [Microcoleus sp. FACHB-831]|uniref:DUF2079 domain-containing protein n=1 Tax=Microcoleus sp. FACHB-831 TaxID=2692827 RepID=UPI001686FB6D|nr:DUF2079 domain-containing protein [Microcoleus sp. FACHB-831]MBD1920411.1 DUF2079 domain-containing protein [Microcoleus sp. FACHB-831]